MKKITLKVITLIVPAMFVSCSITSNSKTLTENSEVTAKILARTANLNATMDFDRELTKTEKKTAKKLWRKCYRCHGRKAQKRAYGVSKILANEKPKNLAKFLRAYGDGTYNGCMKKILNHKKGIKLNNTQIYIMSKYISDFPDVDENTAESTMVNGCS